MTVVVLADVAHAEATAKHTAADASRQVGTVISSPTSDTSTATSRTDERAGAAASPRGTSPAAPATTTTQPQPQPQLQAHPSHGGSFSAGVRRLSEIVSGVSATFTGATAAGVPLGTAGSIAASGAAGEEARAITGAGAAGVAALHAATQPSSAREASEAGGGGVGAAAGGDSRTPASGMARTLASVPAAIMTLCESIRDETQPELARLHAVIASHHAELQRCGAGAGGAAPPALMRDPSLPCRSRNSATDSLVFAYYNAHNLAVKCVGLDTTPVGAKGKIKRKVSLSVCPSSTRALDHRSHACCYLRAAGHCCRHSRPS